MVLSHIKVLKLQLHLNAFYMKINQWSGPNFNCLLRQIKLNLKSIYT